MDSVNKFALDRGYTGCVYEGTWKNYEVYRPTLDIGENAKIGYPLRILKSKNRIRMTTWKESLAYIRNAYN